LAKKCIYCHTLYPPHVRSSKKVLKYVEEKRSVTVEDLMNRFGFKRTTAYNYFSRLRKMGIVSRIGYGRYQIGEYKPPSLAMTPKVNYPLLKQWAYLGGD